MTTIGSPLGTFVCDFGSLKELLVDTTVTCPCCNGRLIPEKLTCRNWRKHACRHRLRNHPPLLFATTA
jgi:hypothetical protein